MSPPATEKCLPPTVGGVRRSVSVSPGTSGIRLREPFVSERVNVLVSYVLSSLTGECIKVFGVRKRVEKWQFSDKFGRFCG